MEHLRGDDRSISCTIAAPYASSPRRTAAAIRRYSNSPSIVCLHCDSNGTESQSDPELLNEVDLLISHLRHPDLLHGHCCYSGDCCPGSSSSRFTVRAGQT